MTHVPYKGIAPAMAAMLAGDIDVSFPGVLSGLQQFRSGRLIPLAIAGKNRYPGLPDVPTAAEAGLPGYEMTTWFALFAPQGTPREIVDLLNRTIADMLDDPVSLKRLADNSVELMRMTPAEFGGFIKTDAAKWQQTIAASHIELQ
jgi:tripartite-type tricarboxylate transporter receptor subunit TctC